MPDIAHDDMAPQASATTLVLYDAAKSALAEAHRVDEVKSIRNKAVAMQAYAQQARDRSLIAHATEIRLRAERRAGQLLSELKKSGGRREARTNKENLKRGTENSRRSTEATSGPPTLSDLGVTKQQASTWQKLATVPEKEFEARIDMAVGKAEAAVDAAGWRPVAKNKRNDRTTEPTTFSVVERHALKVRKLIVHLMDSLTTIERSELLNMLHTQLNDLKNRGGKYEVTPTPTSAVEQVALTPYPPAATSQVAPTTTATAPCTTGTSPRDLTLPDDGSIPDFLRRFAP